MNTNRGLRLRKKCLSAVLGALVVGIALPGQVKAANRALLIGVGKYQMAEANLDGIDLDIGMMKKAANIMGFSDSQVKVLMDHQATLANVKRTMSSWLVNGVSRNDNVLIYFSGHGTGIPDESGDESDGKDEALTMHDLGIVERNGRRSLKGVLVDDDFNALVKRIPTDNVLVMIDACHSGTATKSIGFDTQHLNRRSGVDRGQEKFFQYAGMPDNVYGDKATRSFAEQEEKSASNFIGISAARDDEKAIATSKGSLFTQGVLEYVEKKNAGRGNLTPRGIMQASAKHIEGKLGSSGRTRLFHPQLNGDLSKADKAIRIARIDQGHGPTWRKVEQTVGKMTPLSISANKRSFRKGDKLKVSVDVPRSGYLNVINIDAQDNPIVIFPNKFHKNNMMSAGKVTIPEGMKFVLPAGEPYGPTLLVAFFSEEPVSLFQSAEGKRNDEGDILDAFPRVSEAALKGLSAKAAETRVHGGKLKVDIRR